MKSKTSFFDVPTRGKGLYEITSQVGEALQGTSIQDGGQNGKMARLILKNNPFYILLI